MKIALICIAKNEDSYLYEWLQYHLRLGFDEVFVYENNWRYLFKEAFEDDPVHFIPFDGDVMQLKAYNTFIKEHGNDFDWAAFIDVDEFITKNGCRSLKEILEANSDAAQLGINWRLMGSSGLHKDDSSSTSVVERFTKGDKSLNKHVKQIVNLAFFKNNSLPFPVFINPHCTNGCSFSLSHKKFFGPFQMNGLEEKHELELYHYAVKTPEELHEKVMRGRADTMISRVNEEQEYFQEHDKNDIECLEAKNFWLS